MKKAKFKVGDKVKILDGSKIINCTSTWYSFGMNKYIGQIGTISGIVEYDDDRIAYIMNAMPYRWDERGLERVEEKIIIWDSDNKVYAKNTLTHKEAVAKCSPEDKFNFMTGAKLALERLEELEKPKPSKPLAVGDEVRIINTGKLYSTYDKWVCENIKDDMLKVQFAYGDDLGYSKIPKILKREERYIIRVIVGCKAYIQEKKFSAGSCYLIDIAGLERW